MTDAAPLPSIETAPPLPPQITLPEGDPVPVGPGSHVYLIDGSGYIFRAFHALPPLTRPSDRLPVGAVHGFCAMLWKFIADSRSARGPTHLAVIFDAGRTTFRNAIYTEYKSHRPPPPDELIPQFALIRDAVAAFNIASIEQDGFEADDIIATYAVEARRAGAEVTIVSSDKDLMQLVGGGIGMLDTMKNKIIGRDEVIEKFGVGPERVIDVQALAGDATDNVPGVPGIGIKTAAELIKEYGDLDSLLARAGEIKQPKRREKLIEFADQARISRDLVTLKQDVPVAVGLDRLGVQPTSPASMLAFLRLMEFSTLTKRIAEGLGVDAPPPLARSVGSSLTQPVADGSVATGSPLLMAPSGTVSGAATPDAAVTAARDAALAAPFEPHRAEIVRDPERLAHWIAAATAARRVAIDVRTSNPDAMRAGLVGIALATAPGQACYVPLDHREGSADLFAGSGRVAGQLDPQVALTHLGPLLDDASVLKVGHNVKGAMLVLKQHGLSSRSLDDPMLMSYALDGGPGGHDLAALSERHLGHAAIPLDSVLALATGAKKADRTFAGAPIDKAAALAAETADVALRLWMVLKPRLAAERLATVYETLERPLLPILVDMERAGIKVDRAILSRLSSSFAQTIARLEDEVQALSGQSFNLGSPKQLGELLFDRLKLPGGKKTKTGQWETRAGLLDDLAANEEIDGDARRLINTMMEWRQLTKLKSTYTDSLPGFMQESGRIHTSYALAATTTGRLSSSDPNLQNIPIRTKEGREIRTAFVAGAGGKLVSADYSQIELRVLAHIADIAQLKQAFADGLDIHAMTASEMFGVPIKDMPGEVRRRAKAINFGIIYGISAFGLAAQLSISKQEAAEYISTYFKRFPGIRRYMDETKAFAHDHGYVETVFGRRVHYPEINTRNPSMRSFLERAAINAPIQGSASDIIRRAMIRMPAALHAAGLRTATMLLQVHDELIFDVADSEVDATIATVRRIMEGAAEPAVKLSVPIHVDAKAALDWEAAH